MPSMATAKKLTAQDIADIKVRLRRGEYQHHIAADYGVNQGRVSEINTGKLGVTFEPPRQQSLL